MLSENGEAGCENEKIKTNFNFEKFFLINLNKIKCIINLFFSSDSSS